MLSIFSIIISPRRILLLLISFICISAVVLFGISIFLCNIFYSSSESLAYAGWLGISIGGIALFIMCVIGLRGTHLVNLELLLTYFWGITVFISAIILAIVSSLNSYVFINIWLEHSWQNVNFNEVREYFCDPRSTALNKCIAPINVGSVTEWCIINYNATDCSSIRAEAVSKAELFAQSLALSIGVVGIINLIVILISIYMCYRIITAPVITQSMNDVINYLLLIPISGCIGVASYLGEYPTLPYYAGLSRLNIALAIAQCVALPLGG